MVAFNAYLSSDTPASVAHHIITFDTVNQTQETPVTLTLGHSLHQGQGSMFFTWTIRLFSNSYFTTELLVNNNVVNWIYFSPAGNIDGSVSSTAVVQVNQGDDVLIRTGSSHHSGEIVGDANGVSSFAGWILV